MFLHRIVEGGTDKSYGIHVAQLAGLPSETVARAREILDNLESNTLNLEGVPRLSLKDMEERTPQRQLDLYESAEEKALETLHGIDPDKTTPLEALQILTRLKGDIDKGRL